MPSDIAAHVAELAWAGQQTQAIALATEALAAPGLTAERRLELLELRGDSLVADGRFADAARDADEMPSLAETGSAPAQMVRALNCQAVVAMRLNKPGAALPAASEAVALAESGREARSLAQSLLRLGEAQFRSTQYEPAVACGQRATRLFEADGDSVGQGRVFWVIASHHGRGPGKPGPQRPGPRPTPPSIRRWPSATRGAFCSSKTTS